MKQSDKVCVFMTDFHMQYFATHVCMKIPTHRRKIGFYSLLRLSQIFNENVLVVTIMGHGFNLSFDDCHKDESKWPHIFFHDFHFPRIFTENLIHSCAVKKHEKIPKKNMMQKHHV